MHVAHYVALFYGKFSSIQLNFAEVLGTLFGLNVGPIKTPCRSLVFFCEVINSIL